MFNPSRRLIGASLLTAPLATIATGGVAQATGTPRPVPPIARRKVGRFEVTFLVDGHIDFPYAVFTGIEPAALEQAARGLHIGRPTGVRSGFTQWLIRDGQRLILVDAGPAGTVSPTSGHLPQALAALGVRPEQIDAVILTHLHVDHIAGMVAGGRRVFPNAEIYADRRDVAHFNDPAKAAAAPPLLASSFAKTGELLRLYPRLQSVDGARQVLPGLSLFDLAGHTPGQIGVKIESEGEALWLVGDMLFHPSLHPAHPGIGILFEQDRAAADASRARFFDMAAAEGVAVAATHMPFPGVGRIMRMGGGLQWLPSDWDYAA